MAFAAVVWLDHWHALVATRVDGRPSIIEVGRESEPEPTYLRHVAQVTHDCPRLIILGPDDDRLAFDREYESMYVRPDRFVEIEAYPWAAPADLLDRLRVLEGASPREWTRH